MGVMPYDGMVQLAEVYVKQLEGLAYQKDKLALALQLRGAIDCVIRICGVNADQWNSRATKALEKVPLDPPKAEKMQDLASAQYAAALASPPPAPKLS